MRRTTHLLALGLLVSSGFALPSVASADTVIVLGLRSIEGDDDFAQSLSGALRHAVSQIPGWELNPRELSLAQMMLAHECDDPDPACLGRIGSTLHVDRIVFGTVSRSGSNYDIELGAYDVAAARTSATVNDTIPRAQSDVDELRPRVRRYANELGGVPQNGTIRIRANVADAEILIDGASAGSVVAGVYEGEASPGEHRVEIRSEGHRTYRGRIDVVAGEPAELEVELLEGDESDVVGPDPDPVPDGGGSSINWGAIISFGSAAVFAGLSIGSWVALDCLGPTSPADMCTGGSLDTWISQVSAVVPRDDANPLDTCDFDAVRATGLIDVTPEAESGCSSKSTWQALQYVFLTLTGVSLAAGVVFLVLGGKDDEEDTAPSLTLRPAFSTQGSSLSAELAF